METLEGVACLDQLPRMGVMSTGCVYWMYADCAID